MTLLSDRDILNSVTHLPVVQSRDARTLIISAAAKAVHRRLERYPVQERVQTTLHSDLLAPHVDVLVSTQRKLVDYANKQWVTVWVIALWLPGPTGPYEACRVTKPFLQETMCFHDPAIPINYILSAFQQVEEPVS